MNWIRRLFCGHSVNELIQREVTSGEEMLVLKCVECGKLYYKYYGVVGEAIFKNLKNKVDDAERDFFVTGGRTPTDEEIIEHETAIRTGAANKFS